MESKIEKIEQISHFLEKQIIALFNEFDNKWEYYYCNDFKPATSLDPMFRLEGYRITPYVDNFSTTGFDSVSFKNKIKNSSFHSEIEWSHKRFIIIRGREDN